MTLKAASIYLAFNLPCRTIIRMFLNNNKLKIVAYITGYLYDEVLKVHYNTTLMAGHLKYAYGMVCLIDIK